MTAMIGRESVSARQQEIIHDPSQNTFGVRGIVVAVRDRRQSRRSSHQPAFGSGCSEAER